MVRFHHFKKKCSVGFISTVKKIQKRITLVLNASIKLTVTFAVFVAFNLNFKFEIMEETNIETYTVCHLTEDFGKEEATHYKIRLLYWSLICFTSLYSTPTDYCPVFQQEQTSS